MVFKWVGKSPYMTPWSISLKPNPLSIATSGMFGYGPTSRFSHRIHAYVWGCRSLHEICIPAHICIVSSYSQINKDCLKIWKYLLYICSCVCPTCRYAHGMTYLSMLSPTETWDSLYGQSRFLKNVFTYLQVSWYTTEPSAWGEQRPNDWRGHLIPCVGSSQWHTVFPEELQVGQIVRNIHGRWLVWNGHLSDDVWGLQLVYPDS